MGGGPGTPPPPVADCATGEVMTAKFKISNRLYSTQYTP